MISGLVFRLRIRLIIQLRCLLPTGSICFSFPRRQSLGLLLLFLNSVTPEYLNRCILSRTKGPRKNIFTFWTPMHPVRRRCETSKYREYSCVFASGRPGAYTPNSAKLFMREP